MFLQIKHIIEQQKFTGIKSENYTIKSNKKKIKSLRNTN